MACNLSRRLGRRQRPGRGWPE